MKKAYSSFLQDVARELAICIEAEEQRQISRDLDRQTRRFQTILDQMPACVVVAEAPSGKIIFANKKIHEIWGHGIKRSNNVGEYIEYVGFHPDGRRVQGYEWPLGRTVLTGETVTDEDFEILHGNGKRVTVRISSSPVRDIDGKIFAAVVISYDVTKMKEEENRFRNLANSMPQLIWTANANGEVDYYNEIASEYEGLELKADEQWSWIPVVHPDDAEKTIEAWSLSLKQGTNFSCEHRIKRKDDSYRWHLSRGVPIKNAKGIVVKWYGTATDIHDLKTTGEALKFALTARDDFLSIASHELKTPLTSLKMQAQLQLRDIKRNNPAVFSKDKIAVSAERTDSLVNNLDRLVDDMLDISRIRTGKFSLQKQPNDLTQIVKAVVERMQENFFAADGDKIKVISPDEATCMIDVLRKEQVVQNLLQNALKYGGGKKVEVVINHQPEKFIVSIKDEGIGIPKKKQEKIFDKFERAISAFEISGLGLGLYISREIIEAHQGKIWVESEPGKGTIFSFSLPKLPDLNAVYGQ